MRRGKFYNVLVDARSLQDHGLRFRGVGQHGASILEEIHTALKVDTEISITAIIDRNLPDLPPQYAALFDSVRTNADVPADQVELFLCLSPMTHSPILTAKLLLNPNIKTAAIVHDFIPHFEPGRYLSKRSARDNYYTALKWLSRYNHFIANSEFTRLQTIDLLKVKPEQVHTSGVAVRTSVLHSALKQNKFESGKHVLVVGGGDARKNAECAIAAHAKSDFLKARQIPLYVVGGYPPDMLAMLKEAHAQNGGDPSHLHFSPHVTDGQLAKLYSDAIVTVCPSRSEGFSIPVVEANANGSPVLIANCPAQTELIPFEEDQFDPDDVDRLVMLIENVAKSVVNRARVINRQAGIWERFQQDRVGAAFWAPWANFEPSEHVSKLPAPFIHRGAKPKLAFIGPMPPDKSGVADYTAACLKSLSEFAEIHVFTDAKGVEGTGCYSSLSPISVKPFLSSQFDKVISVIGNSHFHIKPLELVRDYGGVAIAHDARMVQFYSAIYGPEPAAALATKELGRKVEWPEVESWMANQRNLKTLFLSQILESASITILHSKVTQKLITELYQRPTSYLPFAQYRELSPNFLASDFRQQARARLGFATDRHIVAMFGGVVPDKALDEAIWAISMLRMWGRKAELWFVGGADQNMISHLQHVAQQAGVLDHIHFFDDLVGEQTYQDFLAASDASIALRTYGLGGLSGGLLDAIAAGLPTIANVHLAETMESPDFVRRVPDGISPVLIAEKLEEVFASTRFDQVDSHAVAAYLQPRTFREYGLGLMSMIGFPVSGRAAAALEVTL